MVVAEILLFMNEAVVVSVPPLCPAPSTLCFIPPSM